MKMKYVDIIVVLCFVLALAAIWFFQGCRLDLYSIILAGVMVLTAGMVRFLQNRKQKELSAGEAAE